MNAESVMRRKKKEGLFYVQDNVRHTDDFLSNGGDRRNWDTPVSYTHLDVYKRQDIQTGEYAISAGASGAIFGVIGALFYVALRNRGRIGNISSRGLAFMVLCSLYLSLIHI